MATTWQALKVGAGGFISGIDITADGTRLIRTDTYGVYLFSGSIWNQLVTVLSMPVADAGEGTGVGVYEARIAPSNTSRFYMIYNGYVFRTDNRGATWTRLSLAQDTTANPNDDYRHFSPKLAIDPQNADFVVVSTPTTGVSYSVNAGANWTTIGTGSIPAATSPQGYLIAFDPSSAVSGGKTQGIYVSSYGNGVYHSTDAGVTWAATTAAPVTHQQMIVSTAGIVWLINGLDGASVGRLVKYTGTGSWSTIAGAGTFQRSVAIDPADNTHVFVGAPSGALTISTNDGTSWVGPTAITESSADIPWLAWYLQNNPVPNFMSMGQIIFDPSVANTMLQSMGLGVFITNPPTTDTTVVWASLSAGIEQLVANWIVAPPGGSPQLAVWDQGAFTSTNPLVFPSTHGVSAIFAAGWSADWASASPTTIVAAINFAATEQSGLSTDGGATWNVFASTTYRVSANTGGQIAAASATNFVIENADNQLFFTTNSGASWTASITPGAPTSGETGWGLGNIFDYQVLCADRVDANTFYAYNYGPSGTPSAAGVWKSTDSGANWTQVKSGGFSGALGLLAKMRTVPGNAGHLFFTLGKASVSSFQRSTDHGATWSAVTNVTDVWAFGFGKAPAGGYPSIYIAGYVSSVWGVYRSDDNAVSWVSLGANPLNSIDQIKTVEGDPDTYGKVYIGFHGSGFAYGIEGRRSGLRLGLHS